jgi:hypothetical protein
MEFTKKIAADIAKIQRNSDVLAQWPVPAVEILYYSTSFFLPLIFKKLEGQKYDPETLFRDKMLPGKLSHLMFFLLSPISKQVLGGRSKMVNDIINNIGAIREDCVFENSFDSWIPKSILKADPRKDQDVRKSVFMLDMLTEKRNPVFRTLGYEIFVKNGICYRYYYQTGLPFEVVSVAEKGGFYMDFFEHVESPEILEAASVYSLNNGTLSIIETERLEAILLEKLKDNRVPSIEEIIKNLYDSYKMDMPEKQSKFIQSPYPEEVTSQYIKTCNFPEDKLIRGIEGILGD